MSLTSFLPRVHFQEEGCTYRYGIVCLHANGISSFVGGSVWKSVFEYTLPPTRLLMTLACKRIIPHLCIKSLPNYERSVSQLVIKDTVKIKNIVLRKVHFVGLYCTIILCHYIVPLYCTIILCHYIVPLYCTIILCHYIVPLYCTIILYHYIVHYIVS